MELGLPNEDGVEIKIDSRKKMLWNLVHNLLYVEMRIIADEHPQSFSRRSLNITANDN